MFPRIPDNPQRRADSSADCNPVAPGPARRTALVRWSPALRRLLTDPACTCTRWSSPDGSAVVEYRRGGDMFTWTIDGRPGSSDMVEDVLQALTNRSGRAA